MREQFEKWYLRVVKGHPHNLKKDEDGGYRYLGAMYLAWEAATLIEREACAKMLEDRFSPIEARITESTEWNYQIGYQDCADAIRMRSNRHS